MTTQKKILKKNKKQMKNSATDAEFEEVKEVSSKKTIQIPDSIQKSDDKSKNDTSVKKSIDEERRARIINDLIGKPSPKEGSALKKPVASNKSLEKSNGLQNNFSPKAESLLIDFIHEVVPANSRDSFVSKIFNPIKVSDKVNQKLSEESESTRYKGKKSTKNDVFIIHWNGRFGNRMHSYCYAWNRAKKLGGDLYLPSDWEGKHLFNLDYKIVEDDELRLNINQSIDAFDNLDYRMEQLNKFSNKSEYNIRYVNADDPTQNYKNYKQAVAIDSVSAYHHSIFDNMKLKDVLKLYEFSDKVKNLDIYKRLEDKQGTYDIAHLRRDDISNVNYKKNGGYSVISKDSYIKAFKKFDYDPDKIEWTTDDWSGLWGVENSLHSGLINKRGAWSYPIGSEVIPEFMFDWLPDFLRLYFARSIFRANSSFSFWACTLSKGRENPPKIFAPRLDKRILYADEKTFQQEAEFEFEEGNHPHWLCITNKDKCDDIVFSDELPPSKNK